MVIECDSYEFHSGRQAWSDDEERRAGQWKFKAMATAERRSAPFHVAVPAKEPVTLVLPRGASIAGVVVDTRERPIAEAAIFLEYPGEDSILTGDPEPRTRTDPSGRFRVEDVLAGTLEIAASSSELPLSDWIEISVAPGEFLQNLRIQLGGGGRIEGQLDPSLGEIAKRSIGLYSFRGAVGWRDAETDGEGRFVIEGVIPQDYVIELRQTVSAPDGRTQTTSSQIRKNITVVEGQTTEVVFGAPARPVRAHGFVMAAGRPLATATIRALPRDSQEDTGAEALTGVDGSYELVLSGPGDYSFSVSMNYGSDRSFQRTIPEQDEVELSFEVPAGSIAGRVLGSDGRPLAHAPVTLVADGPRNRETFYREQYHKMRAQDDGTFVFMLLPPGTYTLRSPDGFQMDSPPPRVRYGRVILSDLRIEGESSITGLELRLPAESRITGVVVDAGGNGVSGAWIVAMDARGTPLSGDWETRSDATGHFEIVHVAAGVHSVRAKTADGEGTSAPFQVAEGKTASARIELR